MTARESILSTIRTALDVPGAADPITSHANLRKTYNRLGQLSREACLELFLDRLLDYDTEIIQVPDESQIPTAIAEALAHSSEQQALIAPSFPTAWLPSGPTFTPDTNLTTLEIEGIPAVITTCEAAVASTGTIILVHEGTQGRRIITLLPDHHICLVRRDQVFELLPETLTSIAAQSRKPITTISGPSATSDIEMTRIRGVHGPRRLTAILYGHP
jgi:L-lactate dehydrogenase complex protein LldG